MDDARTRFLAVLLAGLVPWTVLVIGGEVTFVFAFGLVNTNPPAVVSVVDFFYRFTDGLPQFIEAWGTGVALYVVALGSALSGLVWRDATRLTAFALTATALSQLPVALGFNRRIGTLVFPLGTVVILGLVWWVFWPAVREEGFYGLSSD